jgi:hypothetical protein
MTAKYSSDVDRRLSDLETRLTKSEAQRRRALLCAAALGAVLCAGATADVGDVGDLTVRRLTVVDENGTPRVMIGAPLPDPPILGRRVPRGDVAHGVLIFDATGTERGGYATFNDSGAAVLTLDNVGHMAVQLAAGPVGGGRLMIRDDAGSEMRLGAYPGGPFVRLTTPQAERNLSVEGDLDGAR